MGVEIEAKMKVDDLQAVRLLLHHHGAKPLGRHLETNIFFDTPDRSLLARDEGIRLRRSRDVVSGREEYVLTSKGPRQQGELKSREELETTVGDIQAMTAILARLGFVQTFSFEKKRESWQLEGCHVELDELPVFGTFVEVEGPSEQVVQRVRDLLGLRDVPLVKPSYIAMVAKYLEEQGGGARTLTFT
jgi:adenylate cyclase class 2